MYCIFLVVNSYWYLKLITGCVWCFSRDTWQLIDIPVATALSRHFLFFSHFTGIYCLTDWRWRRHSTFRGNRFATIPCYKGSCWKVCFFQMHPCQGWWYCWWGKIIHRKGQSYSRCFCFLFLEKFMNGRYYSVSQKRDFSLFDWLDDKKTCLELSYEWALILYGTMNITHTFAIWSIMRWTTKMWKIKEVQEL